MLLHASALSMLVNDEDRQLLLRLTTCARSASFGAMIQVFINWAQKHPEQWSSPREFGVVQALKETWPYK
jgi:hypothetical protein